MPGSFHGSYPTRHEAAACLEESLRTFRRDAFPEEAKRMGLPEKAEFPGTDRYGRRSSDSEKFTISLFQEETVIIGNDSVCWLLDRRSGRTYATYGLKRAKRDE
jgi:hypothetical protein